jgi:hypothetical protein
MVLISHKEWQSNPRTFADEPRTANFLQEIYQGVQNDTNKWLVPNVRKEVSIDIH